MYWLVFNGWNTLSSLYQCETICVFIVRTPSFLRNFIFTCLIDQLSEVYIHDHLLRCRTYFRKCQHFDCHKVNINASFILHFLQDLPPSLTPSWGWGASDEVSPPADRTQGSAVIDRAALRTPLEPQESVQGTLGSGGGNGIIVHTAEATRRSTVFRGTPVRVPKTWLSKLIALQGWI